MVLKSCRTVATGHEETVTNLTRSSVEAIWVYAVAYTATCHFPHGTTQTPQTSRSFNVDYKMFCREILGFDVDGDGSQDGGTFFSLSGEFLEAARVLQARPRGRIDYSSAIYYLLGHSAELLLKAFLYKHGQKEIKDLKTIGHDLQKLAFLARGAGLPEKVKLEQTLRLSAAYREKALEYRTRKRKRFPALGLLTEEIDKLQSAVFDKL